MRPTPEPKFPLGDLLALLREQGLEIGVGEYLSVGRFVDSWDGLDMAAFRTAVAAILAKSRQEAQWVEATFDLLYGEELASADPLASPEFIDSDGIAGRGSRRPRTLSLMATAAAVVLLIGVIWIESARRPLETNPPRPSAEESKGEETTETRPDPPPISPEARPSASTWPLFATGALAISGCLFIFTYRARLYRFTGRLARRHRREVLDSSPGPQVYELNPGDLPEPFTEEVLDDVATELGRRFSVLRPGDTLDVEQTLDRTLEAGLAPMIVLRPPVAAQPILVLEDICDEMRVWRRKTEALLAGLSARGVALDRWYFDSDAGIVWRQWERASQSLGELSDIHSDCPLLLISSGHGVLEGGEFRPASWLADLQAWPCRAWLHPITDLRIWRSGLRELPISIWPMTHDGLMAVASQLASGGIIPVLAQEAEKNPGRRIAPLDVERLRWLLSLAPRRDPAMAEALRVKFCPHVSQDALWQALEMPALEQHPGVGPSEAAVRAYLFERLEDSEPAPGSPGHERWALDLAMQGLYLEERGDASLAELSELASGPLANEVEAAVRPLVQEEGRKIPSGGKPPEETVRQLRTKLLEPLDRKTQRLGMQLAEAEQGRRRWLWPARGDFALAGAVLALLLALTPFLGKFFGQEIPPVQWVYDLSVDDPAGEGSFRLLLQRRTSFSSDLSLAPDRGNLMRQGSAENVGPVAEFDFSGSDRVSLVLPESSRGAWFHAEADQSTLALAVSDQEWVPQPLPTAGTLVARFLDGAGNEVPAIRFRLNSRPTGESHFGRGGIPLTLGAGSWSLDADPEGYDPLNEPIEIRRGQVTEKSFVLVDALPAEGFLEIIGLPASIRRERLRVAGQPWAGGRLSLPPGEVRIGLAEEDLVIDETVTIAAGQVTTFVASPRWLISVASISPNRGERGKDVQIALRGDALGHIASASFSGSGVTVLNLAVDADRGFATLDAQIANAASLDSRQVELRHSAGLSYVLPQEFSIVPAPAVAVDELPPPRSLREIENDARQAGLLGDVFFESDSTELSAATRERLAKNAEFMNSAEGRDFDFRLEGHTEEKRTNEYNLALGEARASAVADFLTSLGVDRSRLSLISFGEERPFCPESNEDCWQQNRRVRFVIIRRR